MPILDVEIVGDLPEPAQNGLARRLADAAGEVLRSRPQGTWVKVRFLEEHAYAENAGGPDAGVSPVFVRVLKRGLTSGEALKSEIEALTKAIAAACGRATENVHIIYEPPGAGRVAFGGQLVE